MVPFLVANQIYIYKIRETLLFLEKHSTSQRSKWWRMPEFTRAKLKMLHAKKQQQLQRTVKATLTQKLLNAVHPHKKAGSVSEVPFSLMLLTVLNLSRKEKKTTQAFEMLNWWPWVGWRSRKWSVRVADGWANVFGILYQSGKSGNAQRQQKQRSENEAVKITRVNLCFMCEMLKSTDPFSSFSSSSSSGVAAEDLPAKTFAVNRSKFSRPRCQNCQEVSPGKVSCALTVFHCHRFRCEKEAIHTWPNRSSLGQPKSWGRGEERKEGGREDAAYRNRSWRKRRHGGKM